MSRAWFSAHWLTVSPSTRLTIRCSLCMGRTHGDRIRGSVSLVAGRRSRMMTMHYGKRCIAIAILLILATAVLADLSPDVYKDLQRKAPEILSIQVSSVDV